MLIKSIQKCVQKNAFLIEYVRVHTVEKLSSAKYVWKYLHKILI